MRVLLTGCNSFIGQELIKYFDKNDINFFGIDLTPNDRDDCIVCDINNCNIVKFLKGDFDVLVHLAGLTRDEDCKNNLFNCFNTNVMGTINLIEACRNINIKQFVFASSEWVYDRFDKDLVKDETSIIDPNNLVSEYALSKYFSEVNLNQNFLTNQLNTTILRFGITYGSRKKNWSAVESIFNNVAKNPSIKVGSLKTGRNFVHVKDICEGILKSLGKKGYNVYNLQGDDFISLGNIIDTSCKILNKSIKILEVDGKNPNIRKVSNLKIKQQLNWKPRINLELGLSELAKFLKYI